MINFSKQLYCVEIGVKKNLHYIILVVIFSSVLLFGIEDSETTQLNNKTNFYNSTRHELKLVTF